MESRILRVDLSTDSLKEETIDEETTEKFVGGRGIGVKILYDELKAGIDPLSPENKLIFMTGPATGTDCKFRNHCWWTETSERDCWGASPSCADCLWSKRILLCP